MDRCLYIYPQLSLPDLGEAFVARSRSGSLKDVHRLVKFANRSHDALAYFASHRCGPSSIPGLGRGRMCETFRQLLAVGRWFPPGSPVSSTRELISSSSFHRLYMTLAVAEALNPNTPHHLNPESRKE